MNNDELDKNVVFFNHFDYKRNTISIPKMAISNSSVAMPSIVNALHHS